MRVATLLQKAYEIATGKTTPPAVNSTKYNKLLSLANSMQLAWQGEPGVRWESTYDQISLGAVRSVASYSVPDTVNDVSKKEGDPIRIVHLSGQESYYDLVQPSDFTNQRFNPFVCTIRQSSLIFSRAFRPDEPQYGGTIFLPAYVELPKLKRPNDTVRVDDPMWLVYMVAAEYARNDLVKTGQYGNIVAYAQNSMEKMKQDNGSQLTTIDMHATVMGESWS